MARLALGAQSALMYFVIVLLVTGVAVGWRIAEQLCLVAFLALHFYMQTKQRESCAPMVEPGVFPFLFVMARFAAFAQLSLVHIIFHVARAAILRQLLLIQPAFMT